MNYYTFSFFIKKRDKFVTFVFVSRTLNKTKQMTKVEVIQLLKGLDLQMAEKFAAKWSDEIIINNWNYHSLMDKKGLILTKSGDEFQITFQAPLSDFTKDAINYFSLNQ